MFAVKRPTPLWPDPRVKPPFGSVEINRGNSFGRSVAFSFLLNEGAGKAVFDLVTRRAGIISAGGVTWVGGTAGSALSISEGYVTLPTGFDTAMNGSFTVSMLVNPSGTGNERLLFGKKGSTNSRMLAWFPSDTTLRTVEENVAYINLPNFSTRLGLDTPIVWTFDSSSTDSVLYWPGTSNTVTRAFAASYTGAYEIGDSSAARPLYGQIGWLHVLTRALADGEVRDHFAEPYAFFRPILRRRYFVPGATAEPVLIGGAW